MIFYDEGEKERAPVKMINGFLGWDFAQISIADIASYSNKKCTKPYRDFFNVFCITQSFDQYYLKVKNYVIPNTTTTTTTTSSSSTSTTTTSTVSSSITATSSNSALVTVKNVNASVPTYLNKSKPDLTSNVDIRATTNPATNLNVPKSTSLGTPHATSLTTTTASSTSTTKTHSSSSPHQFKEYRNERHSYELIHRFLTEGTIAITPFDILLQLFYRPSCVCELSYTPIHVPVNSSLPDQPVGQQSSPVSAKGSLESFNLFSPRRVIRVNKEPPPVFKDSGGMSAALISMFPFLLYLSKDLPQDYLIFRSS